MFLKKLFKKKQVINLAEEENVLRKVAYTVFFILNKNPYGVKVKNKPISVCKRKPGYIINLHYNRVAGNSYLSYPCPQDVVKTCVYASSFTQYFRRPFLVIAEISLPNLLNKALRFTVYENVVPGQEIISKLEGETCLIYDYKVLETLPRSKTTLAVKCPKVFLQYGHVSKDLGKAYYVFLGNLDRLLG